MGWWIWLKQHLALEPLPSPPLALSDAEAAAEHGRAVTSRNTRISALFVAVASLGTLAMERFLYAGAPYTWRVLLGLRLGHALFGALTLAALRWGQLARRPLAVNLGMIASSGALLGYVAGLLHGLGATWFYFTHATLVSLLVAVLALPWRALYCLSLPATLLAGLALSAPRLTAMEGLAPSVAFLLFITIVAVGLGELVDRLMKRGFFAARAQQKISLELATLNSTLEQRVRDQTRELRMLAIHLERAREDERTRIARELHDELGQELTAMRYALELLRKRYERDPGSVRGNLEQLDSLLGRTAATARQILAELRPVILDDLGLDAAVEWLVKQTEERTGIACRLAISARPQALSRDVSNAAFRIIQESLTNVARHARATRVDVEIDAQGGDLCLTVRDDGVGLHGGEAPAKQGERRGGMGLIGIRERAQALGGELLLGGAPGRGTAVEVRLPLGDRESVGESSS